MPIWYVKTDHSAHAIYELNVSFTYRRGVMVARSNELGNPRASVRGASNGRSPRFFVSWGKSINQSFSDTIGRRSALKGKLGQTKYCAL